MYAGEVSLEEELVAVNMLIQESDWSTLLTLSSLALSRQNEHGGAMLNHHYYLGVAHYHLGGLSDAISNLTVAASLNESPEILSALAEAQLTNLNAREAADTFGRARDMVAEGDAGMRLFYSLKEAKAKSWCGSFQLDHERREEELRQSLIDAVDEHLSGGDLQTLLGHTSINDLTESIAAGLPLRTIKVLSGRKFRVVEELGVEAGGVGEHLRVGFISGDWAVHPVSTLLRGVLHELSMDPSIDVVLYSVGPVPSERSWWLHNLTSVLPPNSIHDLSGFPPLPAARYIQAHGLDVLVDLNSHTFNTGLPIMSYRPAPIQVSYLGLPATTALPFIDYYVSDPTTLPLPSADFSERFALLSRPYLPTDHANIAGHVLLRHPFRLHPPQPTIAVYGNWQKMSPDALDLYASVLRQLPHHSLLFYRYQSAPIKEFTLEFAGRGIPARRLMWTDLQPWIDHAWYKTATSFALDTLVKSSHTLALDARYAGVPVVSVAGAYMVNRVSRGLDSEGLSVDSAREMEEIAVRLGRDGLLLDGVRTRIENSRTDSGGLFDSRAYARDFGSVLKGLVDAEGMHFVSIRNEVRQLLDENTEIAPTSMLEIGQVDYEAALRVPRYGSADDLALLEIKPVQVHIGGKVRHPDWINLDAQASPETDVISDMSDLSAFEDESIDLIYASHVLEHAKYNSLASGTTVIEVLKEWRRKLRVGASVMIAVPDLRALTELFLDPRCANVESRFLLMRIMFGGQTDDYDVHLTGFDEDFMTDYLTISGFCKIRRVHSFDMPWTDSSGVTWDFSKKSAVDESQVDWNNGEIEAGKPISLNVIASRCS